MNAMIGCTLREAIRKKTFLVMGIITLLYLIFWTVLLHFFMRELSYSGEMITEVGSQLITTLGLNFSSMLVALLTIMLAAGAISADLETGVIQAMLSRPLKRTSYVFGKFVGYALISCAYATVLYAVILGSAALFGLPAVGYMGFGGLLGGWSMFLLEPVAILCLTVFGSVSLRTVPNGVLVIFVYILGNIGGMVEQVGNLLSNNSVIGAGIFLGLLSPFHTIYNAAVHFLLPSSGFLENIAGMSGGMSGGGANASVWMYFYIGVYMLGFLFLAVRRFEKKDIG
jgi:ABC-type transport system involved in multi-copper enzyme maturation permease subunit